MPIYEYRCKACGTEVEISQRMVDPPAKKCPECGKPKLEKLMSAAGFRLSGGGWYESDFKSGAKKNLAGDKSDAPAKTAEAKKPEAAAKPAKVEKKAESKPAAKAVK
ncbi:MAG: zinc ribbon domain-containing protein [Pseudomonadota bacterium]